MGFWGQVSFLCWFRDRKEPWSSDSSSVQYHIPLNYQTITVYFLTMSHLVIESPVRELSTGTRGFSLWTTHAFLSTGKSWFKTNPQETFGYHDATTSKILWIHRSFNHLPNAALHKQLPRALYQMDMWNKSQRFRNHSVWRVRLPVDHFAPVPR